MHTRFLVVNVACSLQQIKLKSILFNSLRYIIKLHQFLVLSLIRIALLLITCQYVPCPAYTVHKIWFNTYKRSSKRRGRSSCTYRINEQRENYDCKRMNCIEIDKRQRKKSAIDIWRISHKENPKFELTAHQLWLKNWVILIKLNWKKEVPCFDRN